MDPSWTDHVLLISCFHYIIVICLPVSMETLSTSSEAARSVPDESVAVDQDTLLLEIFMDAPCPPKNYLHLICDVNIGSETICSHRALIIEQCLHRFHLIYTNSSWNTCLTDANFCRKTIDVLLREKLIKRDSLSDTLYHGSTDEKSTDSILNTVPGINSSFKTRTYTHSSKSPITTLDPAPLTTSSNDVLVTQEVTSYFTQSTKNTSSVMEGDGKGGTEGSFPPVSYVFPVIGSFFILCEVGILCLYMCYKGKKGPQYKKHPRTSPGSCAVHKEVITTRTKSPDKLSPLNTHLVAEEEEVTEDQDIFKSYMNLKFIDESEEPSPARRLL